MKLKLASTFIALLFIFTSLGQCWESFNPMQASFAGQPGGMWPLKPGDILAGTYSIRVGPAGTDGLTLPPTTFKTFGPYKFLGGHKYSMEITCGTTNPNPNIDLREDPSWLNFYSKPATNAFRLYVRNRCHMGNEWYAVEIPGAFPAPVVTGGNGEEVSFNVSYSGEAISEPKNGKTWPFKLTLIGPDTDGSISGQIEWTSLNSIHQIEGSKTATGITFTEIAYIKKGGAVLNCKYNLNSEGDSFIGTYGDEDSCDDGDYGTISMKPE